MRKTVKLNAKKTPFKKRTDEIEEKAYDSDDGVSSIESFGSSHEQTEDDFEDVLSFEEEDSVDELSDPEMSGDELETPGSILVTKDMVFNWEKQLQNENSTKALKCVLMALRAAVYRCKTATPNVEDTVAYKYTVEEGPIFERLITMTLTQVPQVLAHRLELKTPLTKTQMDSFLQTNSFNKMRSLLKSYLQSLLVLNEANLDSSMQLFILKQSAKSAKFACMFPSIAKRMLKQAVTNFAGQATPEIRVNSFILLRHIAVSVPSVYLEKVLRTVYTAYLRAWSAASAQTWETLTMMMDCYCELLQLDDELAYKIGFTYIRENAMILRNAIVQKTKTAHDKLYSWSFIGSVRLWSKYLAFQCQRKAGKQSGRDAKMHEMLVYPLVQVVQGAIKVLPTVRYLPFRFHCVRILLELQESTQIYIGLATSLLQVLAFSDIRTKGRPSSLKPIDLRYLIKTGKIYLGTAVLRDSVLEELHYLLLAYSAKMSSKIYYPEVAIPILHALKSTIKHSLAPHKHAKIYQQLIKQMEANMDAISKKRQELSDMSPMTFERLNTAGDLPHLLWEQTDLGKHYISATSVRFSLEAAAAQKDASSTNDKKQKKSLTKAKFFKNKRARTVV